MSERVSDEEALAMRFHEAYERLAPSFGYSTREASAKPWADVPADNKALMIAVCAELLPSLDARARITELTDEVHWRTMNYEEMAEIEAEWSGELVALAIVEPVLHHDKPCTSCTIGRAIRKLKGEPEPDYHALRRSALASLGSPVEVEGKCACFYDGTEWSPCPVHDAARGEGE